MGDAAGMVTGLTRRFPNATATSKRVIDAEPGKVPIGYSIVVARTARCSWPTPRSTRRRRPSRLATIAKQMGANARTMGHEPRVAFLCFSNFGSREIERIDRIRKAIRLLDAEKVDFEYDGEMQADMALDYELLRETYPFCSPDRPGQRAGHAGLHSAHISSRLMQRPGRVTVIGPVIDGLQKPMQIVQMGATVSDLVNHAALAAYGALPETDGRTDGRSRHPRRHRRRRPGQRTQARRRRGQGRQDRRHRTVSARARDRSTAAGCACRRTSSTCHTHYDAQVHLGCHALALRRRSASPRR
jgi:malate dehydrogenase (oxaloacetate-decarboxylating)(NADP+)